MNEQAREEQLKNTLEKFRQAVAVKEVYEFTTTPLDRLGIPLYCVALWTQDGTYYDGFGYGAGVTRAKIGAWGEILESYFANEYLKNASPIFASYEELKSSGANVIDPVEICLDAGCGYAANQNINWLAVENLRGEKTLVPFESVAVYPAQMPENSQDKWLYRPITNGLGAGATLAQAIAHGALEIVQRDGNCVSFRALDEGARIELDRVETEETRKFLRFLDEEKNIEIIPKLAGTVAGIPVIHVVGYDRNLDDAEFSMQISACGEAAHPNREIALAKALREYISGRARKAFMHGTLEQIRRVAPPAYAEKILENSIENQEKRATAAVLDWATATNEEIFRRIEKPILETRSIVKFSDLPTAEFSNDEALLAHLQKAFADELGTQILYADFSADAPKGVSVVRTIVPKMEGETMSYNRIGARNFARLLERQKRDARVEKMVGCGAEERPATAKEIYLTAEDAKRFPNAWIDAAAVERQVGDFYALYREPESFTIGKILEEKSAGAANKGN